MALDKDDFEDFMNQCRSRLTGASDAGIKAALFEILKEFFKDSLSWRHHIWLAVTSGTQEYRLTPRDGGQIIQLFGVIDGNKTPVAAFMPEFGRLLVRWPIQVTTIMPANWDDDIAWTASPNPANPWLVSFAENVKKPTTRDNIPVAPEWVLKVYSSYILDGVLGWLMSEPNKSYSNDTKSAYHLRRFRTGIQAARTAAARQNTFGAQTWAYPRGWESRSQRMFAAIGFPGERVF